MLGQHTTRVLVCFLRNLDRCVSPYGNREFVHMQLCSCARARVRACRGEGGGGGGEW